MKDLMFPVGISNFEKIREGGYYYIDKTNLISELLSGGIAEVTLITRPRRFGKSLGMSTLANFLDIRKDMGLSALYIERLCFIFVTYLIIIILASSILLTMIQSS